MTAFTTIAFGMCAYLASDLSANHPTMVMVGNINMGTCEPFIFFPDSKGQEAMFGGHTYSVEVNNDMAILHFDGKNFYFVKDSI